ncbi:hypothetical protein LQZ18_17355 [Lachnospiraceae bacterium ZAX-1]
MNKHDIKRNLPMLTGELAQNGYDRWCQTFIGTSRKTGKRKHFFVEYCIMNPQLGRKEPVMGDKPFQKPAYLMVKAGYWSKHPLQIQRYYGIEEMDTTDTFLKITAGECFLSENNMWGRIIGEHSMIWSLRMDKRIAFHLGYSESRPIRELNPCDMYWHVEGMKTCYEGSVTLDGEEYTVTRKNSYGYADKKWGRDYTAPWFWLYGNQCKSVRKNEILDNTAFAIGGGSPMILGIPFLNKPFADIYLEGRNYEINFSEIWTFTKMKYSCIEKDGFILWHVKAMNSKTAIEIKAICPLDEMLTMDYQNPRGERNPDEIKNGGTAKGSIIIYRRKGKDLALVDQLLIKGVGCEYTKS